MSSSPGGAIGTLEYLNLPWGCVWHIGVSLSLRGCHWHIEVSSFSEGDDIYTLVCHSLSVDIIGT